MPNDLHARIHGNSIGELGPNFFHRSSPGSICRAGRGELQVLIESDFFPLEIGHFWRFLSFESNSTFFGIEDRAFVEGGEAAQNHSLQVCLEYLRLQPFALNSLSYSPQRFILAWIPLGGQLEERSAQPYTARRRRNKCHLQSPPQWESR